MDEARTYAAEYTLQTLGIPTDAANAPTAAAAATAFPGGEHGTLPGVFEKQRPPPWYPELWELFLNPTHNKSGYTFCGQKHGADAGTIKVGDKSEREAEEESSQLCDLERTSLCAWMGGVLPCLVREFGTT